MFLLDLGLILVVLYFVILFVTLFVGLLRCCNLLLICVVMLCVFWFGLIIGVCSDDLFLVVGFLLLLCLGCDFGCLLIVTVCSLACLEVVGCLFCDDFWLVVVIWVLWV